MMETQTNTELNALIMDFITNRLDFQEVLEWITRFSNVVIDKN